VGTHSPVEHVAKSAWLADGINPEGAHTAPLPQAVNVLVGNGVPVYGQEIAVLASVTVPPPPSAPVVPGVPASVPVDVVVVVGVTVVGVVEAVVAVVVGCGLIVPVVLASAVVSSPDGAV
jgi:hypothetical protein